MSKSGIAVGAGEEGRDADGDECGGTMDGESRTPWTVDWKRTWRQSQRFRTINRLNIVVDKHFTFLLSCSSLMVWSHRKGEMMTSENGRSPDDLHSQGLGSRSNDFNAHLNSSTNSFFI